MDTQSLMPLDALGAPDSWTPGLRTAMEVVGASRCPVAVAWGPDVLTLYNDAFAELTGADRTRCIGPPMSELCAEVWRQIVPVVRQTLTHGQAAHAEAVLFCAYRNGYAEERYASLSCKCVHGDAASGDGVLIMLSESTELVVGARRRTALRDVAAAAVDVSSVDEACHRALDAVSRHPADIPFALLYVARSDESGEAVLAAVSGLPVGLYASPTQIHLASAIGTSDWPVAEALETNTRVIVEDVHRRFDPLPAGDWPLAPRSAVVIPLTTSGVGPDAALVVGASARRELDAAYIDFIELVGSHVAAAMAGGRLREDEARRAAARAARREVRARRRARLSAVRARLAGMLEERTRLAREIHDTFLQSITGIALQLRAAAPYVETSPATAAAMLDDIATLAEQASREARQAVWNIRPTSLKWRGFVASLESAARQTIGRTSVSLRVRTVGRPRRLGARLQRAVLVIVREAVANAVRHAEPVHVRITLRFGSRQLRVTVRDDGCGFAVAPDFRCYAGHWGLLGMQERVREVGGSLVVRSAPRYGTRVVVSTPLPARTSDRPLVSHRGE
jgi:signal transduction histidine kinase